MKVRTGGRVVEIPEERMAKGGVDRHAPNRDRAPGRTPIVAIEERLGKPDCNGPAPSPLIFTLKGQMKSGKNRVLITKTGHRYAPKEFRVWRESMVNQICMELGIDRMMIVTPVALIVDYVPGDLIKRDVDGMLSALFHVIVKAGILQDDAQIKNVQWHQWPLDRQNPQVRVVLTCLHTDT